MLYENVELHGFEQLVPAEEGGMWLQRVPDGLRENINEGARYNVRSPGCMEIRFVAAGPVKVTLASEAESRASIFNGTFGGAVVPFATDPHSIDVACPAWVDEADPGVFSHLPFAPRVIRLVLAGSPVRLIAVEGEVRPPTKDELPDLRLLTYGTSITHEASASAGHLSYVSQTASRLGADLINLGVGGSCHCEKAFADYIADRTDWDIASLALSVNMRGFEPDEYARRLEYIVDRVAAADGHRPVACITLWPFFDDLGEPWSAAEGVMKPEFMRQVLRDAVTKAGHPNLHLLEGPELLTNIGGLSGDLIHPADNGMIEMGQNLAGRLAPLVGRA